MRLGFGVLGLEVWALVFGGFESWVLVFGDWVAAFVVYAIRGSGFSRCTQGTQGGAAVRCQKPGLVWHGLGLRGLGFRVWGLGFRV